MAISHDKIITRLLCIMQRLYNGEALSAKELADEFGVNIRTIQRDLNERVSMILPIEKNDKHYYLDSMGGGEWRF